MGVLTTQVLANSKNKTNGINCKMLDRKENGRKVIKMIV